MKDKPEEYWKERLSLEEYRVLREKGTEPPFSGRYLDNHEPGVYRCAACGQKLFSSEAKYDSAVPGLAGWPSFADILHEGNVELKKDRSQGMERTEVVCSNCGSHLGHVFEDGSSQTGQHYCINSVALEFKHEPEAEDIA